MNTLVSLKRLAEKLPYPVGRLAALTPYRIRLGQTYADTARTIAQIERAPADCRHDFVLRRLQGIVLHATRHIPFYQDLYGEKNIELKSIEEFKKLPVIDKPMVRKYAEAASGAMMINTGGTSGDPLKLYIDKHAWAREWAHMHYIWRMSGYSYRDTMITILGKSLGEQFTRYNAVHNEFLVNSYLSARDNYAALKNLLLKFPIRYIQGYPSSIYNMLREVEDLADEEFRVALRAKVVACFLSSEKPHEYIVTYLLDAWGLKSLSWYGHSEMCVLGAPVPDRTAYRPMATYGFAESVDGMLYGTSFNNFDMPLIRYRTGDSVREEVDEFGLMTAFDVSDGRESDFIIDATGRQLSLTAVLFGRHHKIFEVADYVQVHQPREGELEVLVTLISGKLSPQDAAEHFDSRNLALKISFLVVDKPVRSLSNKLKFKISAEDRASLGASAS